MHLTPHRTRSSRAGHRQRGFTLLEVLIAILVLLFGLLGLAGVQVRTTQAEFESYQRKQALILLQDMVDRMQANRLRAACYALTDATGSPYVGAGHGTLPTCGTGTGTDELVAQNDLLAWSSALLGAAETSGGACNTTTGANCIGAMIGARGCIVPNGANLYTVTVAWQGMAPTAAPPVALTCATGLYGNEASRRVVSATVQVSTLN
jgi:type IV pilus assembly protein PilV